MAEANVTDAPSSAAGHRGPLHVAALRALNYAVARAWLHLVSPLLLIIADVEQKLHHDLEYLEHRSLGFDAWVMLKTPLAMARPDLPMGFRDDDRRTQASGAGRSGDAEQAPLAVPS